LLDDLICDPEQSRLATAARADDADGRDPALAKGVNVLEGKLTYGAVAEAHDLDYTPLEDVLPLTRV